MFRLLKDNILTMIQQIRNIKGEMESIKKEPIGNSSTESASKMKIITGWP